MTEVMALLGITLGGFGMLWYKMGRVEKAMNGTTRDFRALKQHCPVAKRLGLCEEDKDA